MVYHLGEPSLELWQWWIDISSRNWFQSIKYVIIYNASCTCQTVDVYYYHNAAFQQP